MFKRAVAIILWIFASIFLFAFINVFPGIFSDAEPPLFIIWSLLLLLQTCSLVVLGVQVMEQKSLKWWVIAACIALALNMVIAAGYFSVV